MMGILDEILGALRRGDVKALGAATTRNFREPIQTIIPWAGNAYTETLIARAREAFGADYWGFWMLGGMSGGGMGFIFAPERKLEAQERMQEIMSRAKHELRNALPFAMEPVVYDFAINERGTWAELLQGRRGAPACPATTRSPCPRSSARTATRCRRRGAPSSTSTAPPAGAGPSSAGWSRPSSTRSSRGPGAKSDGERLPGRAPRRSTASTAPSTSRSAPTCATGASAWPRTACP